MTARGKVYSPAAFSGRVTCPCWTLAHMLKACTRPRHWQHKLYLSVSGNDTEVHADISLFFIFLLQAFTRTPCTAFSLTPLLWEFSFSVLTTGLFLWPWPISNAMVTALADAGVSQAFVSFVLFLRHTHIVWGLHLIHLVGVRSQLSIFFLFFFFSWSTFEHCAACPPPPPPQPKPNPTPEVLSSQSTSLTEESLSELRTACPQHYVKILAWPLRGEFTCVQVISTCTIKIHFLRDVPDEGTGGWAVWWVHHQWPGYFRMYHKDSFSWWWTRCRDWLLNCGEFITCVQVISTCTIRFIFFIMYQM